MKRKIAIALIFIAIIIMVGYERPIEPYDTQVLEFDIAEAEEVMKRAYKPVDDMTNSDLETRPTDDIYSEEEFYKSYDFSYMSDICKEGVFETVADFDENGVVKDSKGRVVFGEGDIISYIPTIYSEDVYIDQAYIEISKYKEKYSYMDKTELIVREIGTSESKALSGFTRTSTFIKNDSGEWILDKYEGTIGISWSR